MPLFHPRVIEKHLKTTKEPLQKHIVAMTKWSESLSKGIYDSETQNDSEFIQRILIDLLGYTGSGSGDVWSLAKNLPLGKGNVDVALGHFSLADTSVIAPFELKGAATKNLDSIMSGRNKTPVQQAWEYAMDAKGAKWVLVSNYREIRLYAVGFGRKDFEIFDLSRMSESKSLSRMFLLLSAKSLLGGLTLQLLKESEQKEKEITKDLYQDYKTIRGAIIEELANKHSQLSPLKIVRFTQTILDRILFIAFAEDKGLLPKNTLKQAYETRNPFSPQPVWSNFQGLFGAINKGSPALRIPGYNGGLFAPNPELDILKLSDSLCEWFKKLGEYDFDSDVDVNILGHIFEQSIVDLEELKHHLACGHQNDLKAISKRKRDGIYYTPTFVTQYIIEQAVGGWLNDRKQEIGFESLPELLPADYASIKFVSKGKKRGQFQCNDKIKTHISAWEAYKNALSSIKVLDPACGSGAFLNEVFDYLYQEGQRVNAELTTLYGGQMDLFRWETHILANNLYGVDINQESVEITKLALWLKTANPFEKLTYLDENIKCGNSLITTPNVNNATHFDWHKEFPKIMKNGGFDVVVGNPPYGAILSASELEYLKKQYQSYEYQCNTYVLFFERGLTLLKKKGILGFITPATFTYQHYFQKIRNLMQPLVIRTVCKYSFPVFEDADIGDTVSLVLQNSPRRQASIPVLVCAQKDDTHAKHAFLNYAELLNKDGCFIFSGNNSLANACENATPLGDCAEIVVGIKPYQTGKGRPKQTKEIVSEKPFTKEFRQDPSYIQCVNGSDFHRYRFVENPKMWLKYGDWLAEPRPGAPFFDDQKIIVRQTADKIIAHIDETRSVNLNNVYNIGRPKFRLDLKYLLAVLNSSVMVEIYQTIVQEKGKLFAEVKKVNLSKLPIKVISPALQKPFIEKVDLLLSKNAELKKTVQNFISLVHSEFPSMEGCRGLQTWPNLDSTGFFQLLSKSKVPLSLAQKSEWSSYLSEQKSAVAALQQIINETDARVDQMVKSLYGF